MAASEARETGPWDPALAQLRKWDPAGAETLVRMTTNPWTSGVLPRKEVELIGVALNAACTTINPDGTRRHIRTALAVGRTLEAVHTACAAIGVTPQSTGWDRWELTEQGEAALADAVWEPEPAASPSGSLAASRVAPCHDAGSGVLLVPRGAGITRDALIMRTSFGSLIGRSGWPAQAKNASNGRIRPQLVEKGLGVVPPG